MSFKNFNPMLAYLPEATKLLRERFKFGEEEADKILGQVMMHFGGQPHREDIKNPRRLFLETVRKFAAAKRREEKAQAIWDRKQ